MNTYELILFSAGILLVFLDKRALPRPDSCKVDLFKATFRFLSSVPAIKISSSWDGDDSKLDRFSVSFLSSGLSVLLRSFMNNYSCNMLINIEKSLRNPRKPPSFARPSSKLTGRRT